MYILTFKTKTYKICYNVMMPFSTGTRRERVGITGLELESSLSCPLAPDAASPCKNKKQRGIGEGSPVVTLMPKLVLSCGEKRSTV